MVYPTAQCGCTGERYTPTNSHGMLTLMQIPKSVVEPFGVIGIPSFRLFGDDTPAQNVADFLRHLMACATERGWTRRNNAYEMAEILENGARDAGTSEAHASIFVRYTKTHNPKPKGTGYYVRYRVPDSDEWHDVLILTETNEGLEPQATTVGPSY